MLPMKLRKNASARIIPVVARKGGVGKTFAAISLAINAAIGGPEKNRPPLRVLFIDCDSQQNSSKYFLQRLGAKQLGNKVVLPPNPDCPDKGVYNISDIFAGNDFLEYPTEWENIMVIPSDGNIDDFRKISDIAKKMTDDEGFMDAAAYLFREFMNIVKDEYDLIVIDTPPSKTYASSGAITAGTDCLIVANPDSHNSGSSVPGVIADIEELNETYRPENPVNIIGILLNKISSTRPTKHEATHITKIKQSFPKYVNSKLFFCNYVAFNTEMPQSPNNLDWMNNPSAFSQMVKFYDHISETVLKEIYEEAK